MEIDVMKEYSGVGSVNLDCACALADRRIEGGETPDCVSQRSSVEWCNRACPKPIKKLQRRGAIK